MATEKNETDTAGTATSTESGTKPARKRARKARAAKTKAGDESGGRFVWVEILRPYPRGGVRHQVGARIRVPHHALKNITKANPPFGKQISAPNT